MDRRRFLELSGGATAALLAGCGGGGSGSSGGGVTPTPTGPDWAGLKGGLNGQLVRPGDSDYDSVRLLANMHFDAIKPVAIIKCASVADVQNGLAFVQKNGFLVTPRCGGHSWGGTSTINGVVLNVTPMNAIQVNNDGTAVVGAGARVAEVYDTLISQGVCIPSASCLTVGISGVTMGGGIGILDRKFGLTCDNLLSADVVTADGRLLTCDDTHEPDLFWAIRGGGGGNFGVATSFTFRTHPIQDITEAGAIFLNADFPAVFKAWQQWPQSLPDNIWGQIIMYSQGGGFSVRAFCLGTASEMQPYWDAFVASTGATPYPGDATTPAPYVTQRSYRDTVWAMCGGLSLNECSTQDYSPTGKVARYDEMLSSDFFNSLIPDAGISELVQIMDDARTAGTPISYIFDHMGGALGRVAPDATAFVHRNALFSLEYATWLADGTIYDPTLPNQLRARMKTWSSGGAYVNYMDPLLENWQTAYYGANYAKLQQVKAAYDPKRVFNMAQGVVPA